MHITFQETNSSQRAALSVHMEPEESIPNLSTLLFDISPSGVGSLQTAVAAALLFGSGALSRFKVDGELRHSEVERISEILGIPVESDSIISENTITNTDQKEPLRVTSLEVSLEENLVSSTPGRDETKLILVSGERYFGGLLGIKEAVVASNAWLHATYVDPVRIIAATGVLFANEFLAACLVLPETSSSEKDVISSLCRVAGLETRFGAAG